MEESIMKIVQKISVVFSLTFVPLVFFLTLGASLLISGCSDPEYTLEYTGPSPGSGDAIYPKTPTGQQIKKHLTAMAGVGEDAEANYQKSLAVMRLNPEVLSVLAEVYEAIVEEDYFRRTLVVETLKEMHSVDALSYLARIANTPIPEDRMPKNTEVNTREDEIVIRITAVQGLSVLAAQDSSEANNLLLKLVSHDDLTVRQMSARGYLGSSVGSLDEKLKQLHEIVPEDEHWYLTTKLTEIRKVQHPEVLPDFDLEAFMKQQSNKAPRVEERK
jgi:hypothetical protein